MAGISAAPVRGEHIARAVGVERVLRSLALWDAGGERVMRARRVAEAERS
jgi:hypothetical protein